MEEVAKGKAISERACVDLVQKLIAREQVKLLQTLNGKEWLTPEQLDNDIRDALNACGGRLNVMDLPAEVGVAVEHCENCVEALRKRDSSFVRLHGELITGQYLANLAQDVAVNLEVAGCLAVADLAAQYSLTVDFIKASVLPRLEVPGLVVKQSHIYAGAHAARAEARVRGALRGCTQPVTLEQLATCLGLDTEFLTTSVKKVLKDGAVQGKLQGSTFTPDAHSKAQASKVDSFFDSNQFLGLSLAKSAGLDVKDWVKSRGLEGVTLVTAFVGSQLVDAALASVCEAVAAESWVDVAAQLPPALSDADARELLVWLSGKKRLPANTLPLGRVAVSNSFVKAVAGQFDAEVNAAAERAASAPSQGKASKKSAPAPDEDDEGSKKKGKRAAKGRKGRADDDDAGAATGGTGGGGGETGIDDQAILDLVYDKYPDFPMEVHTELVEQVQPLLVARVAERQAALRSSLQSKQQARFEHAEKLVQERYEALVLGFRALEATSLQDSPLQQHLLREAVAEPLHQMIALRLQESTGTTVEVTSANRKQCVDKLVSAEGAAAADSLVKLVALFSKGKETKDAKEAKESKEEKKPAKGKQASSGDAEASSPGEVGEQLYRTSAGDCHIFCRKVDKKREKAVLQEKRAELREKLKEATGSEPARVLHLGLQLALVQEGVPGLLFPEEPWALRITAQALADEGLREQAVALCDLQEKAGDPVALEAALAAWKERALSSK